MNAHSDAAMAHGRSPHLVSFNLFGLTLAATLLATDVVEGQSRPLRVKHGFKEGDLYLCSRALPGGAGYMGVLHISPATGAVSPFFGGSNILFDTARAEMVYDPYRDRLLVAGSLNGVGSLYKIAVTGDYGTLGFQAAPACMAATGDGRVYLTYFGSELWCIDSTGAMNRVLDQNGSYFQSAVSLTKLFYDAQTNALINTVWGADCGSGSDNIIFHRMFLSPDGMHIQGAPGLVSTCIVGRSTGICRGPNGLFMTFDNNTNDSAARMLDLDPITLSLSTFACNGPYIGAAATNAGTYNFSLGKAIVLDTGNDVLRSFSYDPMCTGNNNGLGSILATGVSGQGGSGELATLVSIERF